MSFRLEMLQVARLAPKVLGESADLVVAFLHSQRREGGFADRSGRADLYYTVFGLEGMLALQQNVQAEEHRDWLHRFGTGEGMDFVHLCCLARCWAALKHSGVTEEQRIDLAQRLEAFASREGGYHVAKGRTWGSAYGCLLAAAAYEDLLLPLPRTDQLKACMDALRSRDGGWTNEAGLPLGIAPATAAALSLYRRMGWPVPTESVAWLKQCFVPAGGCKAMPAAPMPDLLSTAVALHGLAGAQADVSDLQEACLDYVDSLWSNAGGFHGNWTDHTLDCEYTYYGLLALGHLT
jgi:hypothetical protein